MNTFQEYTRLIVLEWLARGSLRHKKLNFKFRDAVSHTSRKRLSKILNKGYFEFFLLFSSKNWYFDRNKMLKLPKEQRVKRVSMLIVIFSETVFLLSSLIQVFFSYLGFLSRIFMNHRTAGEGGGHFINSSLPLPATSKIIRHQPNDYCTEFTSAHSWQPDSTREPLISQRSC